MTSGDQNSKEDTIRQLLGEGRWSRQYRVGTYDVYESKLSEAPVPIPIQSLTGEWASWSTDERFEFVRAFSAKSRLTENDEKILEFLLGQDDPRVTAMLAICLTAHSNKEMAFQFLLRQSQLAVVDRGNYFQALAILGDNRATPILRDFYTKNIDKVSTLAQDEEIDDMQSLLLMCCAALGTLTQNDQYWKQLERFQLHTNKAVRSRAKMLMNIWHTRRDGPPL